MEVIIAHGSGGGLGLLAFLPAGLLLLVGLVLMLSPVVSQTGRPVVREEDEDDLANRLLGEEEAQRLRKQARRRRAVRRRTLRGAPSRELGHGRDSDETWR
jgi:hypothetical protein